MLQPTCRNTWRRAEYIAKSLIAKQAGYNFTKTKKEGCKFTKEGNSEEVGSKKAEDELRCELCEPMLSMLSVYLNMLSEPMSHVIVTLL
jgi:hypothetical protein